MSFVKHLVECNCVLPQYTNHKPTVFHKFVVFSLLDDTNKGKFIPGFAQCNNCGAIHKVTEVFKSKTIAKDSIGSLPKLEELKVGLNQELVSLVEEYKPEIHTWQEINHVVKNSLWGRTVILSKETVDETTTGKFLLIAGASLFKIDSFTVDTSGENEEDNDGW